jgi:hypothetical protein
VDVQFAIGGIFLNRGHREKAVECWQRHPIPPKPSWRRDISPTPKSIRSRLGNISPSSPWDSACGSGNCCDSRTEETVWR